MGDTPACATEGGALNLHTVSLQLVRHEGTPQDPAGESAGLNICAQRDVDTSLRSYSRKSSSRWDIAANFCCIKAAAAAVLARYCM